MHARATFVLSVMLLAGCGPLHLQDSNTTSTPTRPPSFDVAELTRERVAVLGVVTPAGQEGFALLPAHALEAALAKTSPPVPAMPAYDTKSMVNAHGSAAVYADLLSGFGRSGILDRERLGRIGAVLGCRYVFLPGLAQLNDVLADRFEAMGIKIVRNRVVTLRLWLQLWDTKAGRIVWESSGEATASSLLVFVMRSVPLDGIAERLWLSMLRDGLLPEPGLLSNRRP